MTCAPLLRSLDGSAAPAALVKECDQVESLCRRMVFQIGRLTIPARLNQWLKSAWAGYLIPFHDVFSEELPLAEDRNSLLRRLAYRPDTLQGGIVDAKTGIIYPYHHSPWRRWAVIIGLIAWFVFITVVIGGSYEVPFVSKVLQPFGVNGDGRVLGWLMLGLGVLVHDGLDRGKQAGSGQPQPPTVALGHVSCAIDARAGIILMKSVSMLIGFFLMMLLGSKESNTPFNMFLVGYSLDSFLGIFGSTLDRQAAARGAALSKALKTPA